MKGTYYTGLQSLETRDLVLPPLGEKDILVRNEACGVCGTDIHIYHGEPGSAQVTPPVILGHEYAGIVEQVGAQVENIQPGMRVSIDPNLYCGLCAPCRKGKKHLCENMSAIGVTRDGGFAQYSMVPASQAYPVSPALDAESAACAEPLSCCIHGMDLAGIRSGDTVLVIGGGFIGLLMVQLARLAGASKVILSEPKSTRRAVAQQLGCHHLIDPVQEDFLALLNQYTGGQGADVVLECAGAPKASLQAVQGAAKGATILLFSVPAPQAALQLSLYDVFKKELVIKGSFVNPDTFSRAIALLESQQIVTKPLITDRYPVEELEAAIAMQTSDESIKVMVV
ncbi:MAG: zinc-dependent alcohol dehydrogenase family protein [Candidatus Limiplasma sp.]|nr:zinc-dependent alcohol dehydrogenase family protein [Candidatus Limiplasma sp.]